MLNLHNCVNSLKIVQLNVHDCVHSLKDVYVEYSKLRTSFENCVFCRYKIMFIFQKVRTLNKPNYVHPLKSCVCQIYRTVYMI